MKGTWQLRCIRFDSSENEIGSARYTDVHELNSDNEKDAAREARAVWKIQSKDPYQGWDGCEYPRDPSLIYEVELDDWLEKEL